MVPSSLAGVQPVDTLWQPSIDASSCPASDVHAQFDYLRFPDGVSMTTVHRARSIAVAMSFSFGARVVKKGVTAAVGAPRAVRECFVGACGRGREHAADLAAGSVALRRLSRGSYDAIQSAAGDYSMLIAALLCGDGHRPSVDDPVWIVVAPPAEHAARTSRGVGHSCIEDACKSVVPPIYSPECYASHSSQICDVAVPLAVDTWPVPCGTGSGLLTSFSGYCRPSSLGGPDCSVSLETPKGGNGVDNYATGTTCAGSAESVCAVFVAFIVTAGYRSSDRRAATIGACRGGHRRASIASATNAPMDAASPNRRNPSDTRLRRIIAATFISFLRFSLPQPTCDPRDTRQGWRSAFAAW